MKLILTLLLIFSVYRISGQNFEKLLEKKNWVKLEEKIQKSISEDSTDVIAFYYYSLFYQDSSNSNMNLLKAYLMGCAAEHAFDVSVNNKNKMKQLSEENFTKNSFENNRINICNKAFEVSKKENTIESYEYFITNFASCGKCYENAVKERDTAAFEFAAKINTEQSYQQFIEKNYKTGLNTKAYIERDRACLNFAIKENSISAYSDFLNKYPNSSFSKEVIEKRSLIAFNNAKEENSISAFEKYIDEYPFSSQAKEAELTMYSLAFAEVESINTEEGYNKFITKYPNSAQVVQAIKRRNRIAFDNAKAINSRESYNSFIIKYPDANEVSDAKILMQEFEKKKDCFNGITGKFSVTGYGVVLKEEVYGEILTYAFFKVLKSDCDTIFDIMKKKKGNFFWGRGDSQIALGCIQNKVINYINISDKFGQKEFVLTKDLSKMILESSKSNPITIIIDVLKDSSPGSEAPNCYSPFTTILLQEQ